jgi:hypothetical protein
MRIRTNPNRLEISDCTVTSYMTPRNRRFLCIDIVPEKLTQLLPNPKLNKGRHWTSLERDIVRVIQHGHKIPEE